MAQTDKIFVCCMLRMSVIFRGYRLLFCLIPVSKNMLADTNTPENNRITNVHIFYVLQIILGLSYIKEHTS